MVHWLASGWTCAPYNGQLFGVLCNDNKSLAYIV